MSAIPWLRIDGESAGEICCCRFARPRAGRRQLAWWRQCTAPLLSSLRSRPACRGACSVLGLAGFVLAVGGLLPALRRARARQTRRPTRKLSYLKRVVTPDGRTLVVGASVYQQP